MAYIDAITELEQRLFKFDPQAQKVYNLINDLKSFIPVEATKETVNNSTIKIIKLVFDKNAPATEQVLFAIKYLNEVSKAASIYSAIREFDSSFDKQLSTPFYKLKEEGLIKIFNPSITSENPTGSNHQVYYGLSEWFEAENKVKDGYLPNDLNMNHNS